MKAYSKEDIEKIGNTIVYFAEKINELSKTKLLKLLYLLEESYVKRYSIPFLEIEFEVWQAGPVARDIFIELSDSPDLLHNFIKISKTAEATYIKPIINFCDDEFSDNEIEMLETVVEKFGRLSASELVHLTHRKSSNWYHVAKQNNLLHLFEKGLTKSSDEKIDFSWYLDEENKTIYNAQIEHNKLIDFINE